MHVRARKDGDIAAVVLDAGKLAELSIGWVCKRSGRISS